MSSADDLDEAVALGNDSHAATPETCPDCPARSDSTRGQQRQRQRQRQSAEGCDTATGGGDVSAPDGLGGSGRVDATEPPWVPRERRTAPDPSVHDPGTARGHLAENGQTARRPPSGTQDQYGEEQPRHGHEPVVLTDAGSPSPSEVPPSPRTPEPADDALIPAWMASGTAPGTDGSAAASPRGASGHTSAHTDLTWDEAYRVATGAAAPAAPATVPLGEAAHHVLAASLRARADLPPFDTSAMDGWAVSGPGPWALLADTADVLAGGATPAPLSDGCAVRIATGARLPEGATAVLRAEHGQEHAGRLRAAPDASGRAAANGGDIRVRGQECRSGDRLAPAGTVVTPAVLGLAAAAGYDELLVTPRPEVEVLVLGDELLARGLPRDGRVRDALGPMVGPWLAALGVRVSATRRLGDDAEALYEAVTTSTADLLVTTGGTAHGPVDHVRPVLRRVGARLLVDGVRARPGHPMLLAALAEPDVPNGERDEPKRPEQPDVRRRERHLVGLPGNPLAAVSGLVALAAPLIRARAGRSEPEPRWATLTAGVSAHPRDTRLVPVARTADGTGATPLHFTGPAMLRGLTGATALALVPPGDDLDMESAPPGTSVQLLEMPW